jgi:hypothetical protein
VTRDWPLHHHVKRVFEIITNFHPSVLCTVHEYYTHVCTYIQSRISDKFQILQQIAHTKGAFPPSHFSNKLADKLAYKVASQTNVTHFCLVSQSKVCCKPNWFATNHGLATKEGCRTRCKSRNLKYAMGVRSTGFTT